MLCLLCPTPDDRAGSDFESLFGEFVHAHAGLWWSINGGGYSPWTLPPEVWAREDGEEAFYAQLETVPTRDIDSHLADSKTFGDTMMHLTDFWIEVHAFREKPKAIEIESWWAGDALPMAAEFARGAEHAFINVDGAYWAVLSLNEALLRQFAHKWPLAKLVPVSKVPV